MDFLVLNDLVELRLLKVFCPLWESKFVGLLNKVLEGG